MSRTIAVACRVDFRAAHSGTLKEQVGRVELLSASGCTILSHPQPAPETLFELRIALPDGHWPLIVERAQGHREPVGCVHRGISQCATP